VLAGTRADGDPQTLLTSDGPPVLLLTPDIDEVDHVGFGKVLRKPARVQDVAAALRDLLGSRSGLG
jgi:hypothetical protein